MLKLLRLKGIFSKWILFKIIYSILGLWTGLAPNILRNATINAAELATYDEVKTFVIKRKGWMKDNIYAHFVCSAVRFLI